MSQLIYNPNKLHYEVEKLRLGISLDFLSSVGG